MPLNGQLRFTELRQAPKSKQFRLGENGEERQGHSGNYFGARWMTASLKAIRASVNSGLAFGGENLVQKQK